MTTHEPQRMTDTRDEPDVDECDGFFERLLVV
jgi:hypothetical protein